MSKGTIGLVLILLAGCTAPVPFQKGSVPTSEGRFAGDYEEFAACVAVSWNTRMNGAASMFLDRRHSVAYITVRSSQPYSTTDQTTVRQVEPGVVLVQEWFRPTLVGAPDWVWEMVEACAEDGAAS